MNVYISSDTETTIKDLYLQGHSPQEIKDELNLSLSTRQLQRWVKDWGISRSGGDAFRLAVARGRVTYWKKPIKQTRKTVQKKIRYLVLARDQYRCVKCGATAKDERLQVDHIDNDPMNGDMTNLQTLCESCNKGKYRSIREL